MPGKQSEMLGNGWKMLGNKQTNATKVAQNVKDDQTFKPPQKAMSGRFLETGPIPMVS